MNKIDCFGDICPLPLLKAQKEIKNLKKNEPLLIITDHSCSAESLKDYFTKPNYSCEIEEVINGVFEITVRKLT